MRKLDSPLRITVNGKETVIKKREGVAKQLVNKSLPRHLASTRMVHVLQQQELESAAELQRLKYRTADDFSDDELAAIACGDLKIQLYKESTPDGKDGK